MIAYGTDYPDPLAPPPRRVVLTPASSIQLRAPRWLWDTAPPGALGGQAAGRIPAGALTIGAGRAGIGKSQHAAWLAAHVTRGTLPGCHYGRARSVIYAAAEDSWAMTIAPRLVAAGADLGRVYRIEVADDDNPHARLTLPTDTHLLEQAIRAHDVALMVMDPLLSLVDATVNDYRAREVRDALEPLLPIADRTGCALFGLAHFTKAAGNDPLLLIAGSGAFGQLVRAGIGYARDEDSGGYVLSTIKSNLGREDLDSLAYRIEPAEVDTADGPAWVSRLVIDGTAERSVRDVLRDAGSDEDRTERDEAADWLTGYLIEHGGQALAGDVIKAAARDGIAKTTLTRARQRAGVRSTKAGMRGGWVWDLDPRTIHEETEEPTHTYMDSSVPSLDSSTPQPTPDTANVVPLGGNPRCQRCDKPNLFAPASIERGICAACIRQGASA